MFGTVIPMVALTATVAATALLLVDRNTAYDAGALADSMARHHTTLLGAINRARAAGGPVPDPALLADPALGPFGKLADPDLGPFGALHDWDTAVFDSAGQTWLVTYAEDFDGNGGTFGQDVLRRVPVWLNESRRSADGVLIFGVWDWTETGAEVSGITLVAEDSQAWPDAIDEFAPVILTRL